jgi:hypothetical protein
MFCSGFDSDEARPFPGSMEHIGLLARLFPDVEEDELGAQPLSEAGCGVLGHRRCR